jgi:hypothetical protein
MKKFTLLVTLLVSVNALYSQCTSGSSLGSLNVTTNWQTIAVSAGVPAYRSFSAQSGGTYIFTFCQGGGSYSGDPYLTITDNSPSPQTTNDDYCGLGSQITWTCTSSGTYRIYFSGCCPCANAYTSTCAYIGSNISSGPPNDLCANASPLAIPSSTGGTTVSATAESPAPPSCVIAYSQPGVWYTVVGDGNQLSASLCNTNWDSKIYVYTGSCGNWSCVTGNDDSGPICQTSSASVKWCSTLNTTYYILVTGYSSASAFTLDIATTVVPTPVVTPSTVTICAGVTTTLVASGSSTYTWNPGNYSGASQALTPSVTTIYTVTGTDATTTCSNTATATVSVNPSAVAPTLVTATPSTICIGGTTQLNATAADSIKWWTAATGGTLLGTTLSATNFPRTPLLTTTYYAETTGSSYVVSGTQTFSYTGSAQTFTVPAGCTSITMDIQGAQGGNTNNNNTGGSGGRLQCTYPVTPGGTLNIYVGGNTTSSAGGFNGGGNGGNNMQYSAGGGGASDIRIGGSALANRVLVAGGGAGGGTNCWGNGEANGGHGGNATGQDGFQCNVQNSYQGTGGSQSSGGISNGGYGTSGTLGVGGNGNSNYGGGGGGGYYGGGGGSYGGGGGGSTFYDSNASSTTLTQGYKTGNGEIILTWNQTNTACPSQTRIPVTVTVNPLPVVTANSTAAAVCAGASVTLTGGGASTYAWSGGVTNAVSFVPVSTVTYTVTGTSAAGCVNTATTTVTVNPLPTVFASSSPGTICVGGSSTITASGATTYAWMPGNLTGASITVSPIATTTYTVTGTNANGCINTATRTITVNPLPIVTATSTSAAVCTGASVTLTGGGASTYSWSGGVTNAVSFIPTATTTYTVTGTNANGCLNTATITITVNPLPIVTTATTAATICIGASTTITASGATTYAWMPGNLTGATVTVSPIATTTYTVTGTNANGCINTTTRIITVNPLPVVTATSVTLTGGGATSYSWSGGVTDAVSFIPTATVTYTVTGTNANGCVNTATITVTVNPLPAVTATSTSAAVCSGASVTLTGGGATTYTWDNNVTDAISFVPTATTTYMVTGTDANGCVNTATTTVTVNPLPVVTANSSVASVCAGSSVTLTGGGASTYTWDNNVTDAVSFVPTATTTYMVTGTDANGCVNTAMTTVTVNPLPVVTATSSAAVVCAGASVTLTGGGAATYTWDNNVTDTVSFVPMATTTYIVTGTDANGCVNTATTTVTVNALPTVTANTSSAAVCMGASVTLTGGGAATYVWDNNVMDTVSFVPTATTTYMVTGTDANGCVNTAMTTVTVNPLPTVTANSSAASVCTGGSVTLTGGGASTYTWDNNVIDAVSFVPTATTTYMVTGTDANGCVNTATTTVTLSGLLTVSLGPDIIQCGGTALLDAGNIGSVYLWNNASTTQTITVSASGTYIVDVTDVNGCMGTDTAVVTINTSPSVTATASSSVVCVDDSTVTLTGTPTGGVWSGPGVTGSSLSPTAAGVGSHTAVYSYTDVNGCEGNTSVIVQVDACVGLVENTLANGVSVYPNPNNGSFTLSVNANVADLVIKITDMQGRVVYASVENNVNAGFVKQISLDTQSSGMYLMHIIANGEQRTEKISVQK